MSDMTVELMFGAILDGQVTMNERLGRVDERLGRVEGSVAGVRLEWPARSTSGQAGRLATTQGET